MLISADGSIQLPLWSVEQSTDFRTNILLFYVVAIITNDVDITRVSTTTDWVYNNTNLRLYSVDIRTEKDTYIMETLRGGQAVIEGQSRTYAHMTLAIDMLDVMQNNDIVHMALRTEEGRKIVADAMVDKEIPEIIERHSLLDPLSEY